MDTWWTGAVIARGLGDDRGSEAAPPPDPSPDLSPLRGEGEQAGEALPIHLIGEVTRGEDGRYGAG